MVVAYLLLAYNITFFLIVFNVFPHPHFIKDVITYTNKVHINFIGRLSMNDLDFSLSLGKAAKNQNKISFFHCGHVRLRSEEEGLDLSILCREGCALS